MSDKDTNALEDLRDASTTAAVIAMLTHQAAVASSKPQAGTYPDAAPFLVLREADGKERVEFIKETLAAPTRKRGKVLLNDADSFIAYYKLHGNAAPVYAGLEPAQFIAVLNDHTRDAAGWRDYRATYTVKHAPEWDTWTKHNGSGAAFNGTESFALFLEENALDIVKPEAAKMLQIALNFRLNNQVNFSSAQRLQDGNAEFSYSNIVNATAGSAAGGKLTIPEQFTIEIPVFAALNPKRYRIDARFRFRLREGGLTLWYELIHPRKAKEQAFKDMWAQIEKETKATLFHGTPE